MEENIDRPIEDVIIDVAKKLFISKGFKGTTMRDIASGAGVNLALVNYYFRSKDKLFELIFEEAFQSMFQHVSPVLSSDLDVLKKIDAFINQYIEGLKNNPCIPGFIFHEIFTHPERLLALNGVQDELVPLLVSFKKQLKEEAEQGIIQPIDNPMDLFLNIVSMCAFPFIAKPIVEHLVDHNNFMDMMEQRKKSVSEFARRAISRR